MHKTARGVFLGGLLFLLLACSGKQEEKSLNLLMEDVPETRIIEKFLPEFLEKTGITVNFEIVQYSDMHAKLVTQLAARESRYDVIEVDNYWVGEFPPAGWLEPLDSYIEKSGFDLKRYVPSMLKMFGYGRFPSTFIIPMHNYTMALIYRKDLLADPGLQKSFQQQFNEPLAIPSDLQGYVRLAEFMQKNAGVFGSAMQAQRGDPIAMEWSNYLFALGGDYYDQNWNAQFNSDLAKESVRLYQEAYQNAAPEGSSAFNLDDAFRLMAQGKAFSIVTYNWMLAQLEDPANSKVSGKVALSPMPGEKGLAGGWGWSIAHNTKKKDLAWEFIHWVESDEMVKKRALVGGAPVRLDVFADSEVLHKYPFYPVLQQVLERSKPVPEFQYSTEMIEVLGRELSLIVSENKDVDVAMNEVNEQLNSLAVKAKLR